MIIRLKVFEQTLSVVDTKSVPRKGSKDYLVLHFLFSSDWKDLNKVCYLQSGNVSQPIDVVDNLVEVPEWFTQQESFDVTLFGKSGNQEVPTNVVSLRLEKSNTLWEQNAPEPQPSWLAKVIDLNNHPPIPGDNGYWLLWNTDSGAYVESELSLPAVGGTSDHSNLINRDAADQHPMSAVTGLVEALEGKQPAGMGITGATVGQIAKITSVDDSGKPTAWEAADMPSGGGGGSGVGSYKFIQTVTIPDGENVSIVEITIPAKTRKLYVLGKTNTGSTFGATARASVKNGNISLAAITYDTTMSHRKALFSAELYDDIQFMSFSSSNSGFNADYPGYASFNDYASYFSKDNNIFQIMIKSASSTNQYFAAGCTFDLYAACEE